jgi:hypothetical protein
LLRAQFNVGARPGTCSRAPVGQATRVGPAATEGRVTAGPRLPGSVGTSKRLLALHPVRDLAERTTSGTRVLRPLAAVARPEVLGHQGLGLTPCQTPCQRQGRGWIGDSPLSCTSDHRRRRASARDALWLRASGRPVLVRSGNARVTFDVPDSAALVPRSRSLGLGSRCSFVARVCEVGTRFRPPSGSGGSHQEYAEDLSGAHDARAAVPARTKTAAGPCMVGS